MTTLAGYAARRDRLRPRPATTAFFVSAWAREDRVMSPEHTRRLAELLPDGHLAEVDDSYTLIPLDQPAKLAQLIREFTQASVTA